MKRYKMWTGIREQSFKKHMVFWAFCGFAAGILAANTFAGKRIKELGLFGDYFFMQIQNTKLDAGRMFRYIFEKRMLFCLVLVFLGFTSVGAAACCLLSGWLGMSAGLLFSGAVIQRGMSGLGICIAGLLPQYLFYVPAVIMLMIKTSRLSARLYRKEHGEMFDKGREVTAYLLVLMIAAVLFFAGILMESFINPVLLQKIYKIFNNI